MCSKYAVRFIRFNYIGSIMCISTDPGIRCPNKIEWIFYHSMAHMRYACKDTNYSSAGFANMLSRMDEPWASVNQNRLQYIINNLENV